MQKIISYFRVFFQKETSILYYFSLLLFLSIAILLNYTVLPHRLLIELAPPSSFIRIPLYMIFFSIPYFGALLLYSAIHNRWNYMTQTSFWIFSSVVILAISLRSGMNMHIPLIIEYVPTNLRFFAWKMSKIFIVYITYLIPAILYWFYMDRKKEHLYGFTARKTDFRPYLYILLISAPFIFLASYQADFMESYPRYKTTYAAHYWKVSPFLIFGVYEIFYLLGFVALEFFFRGFIVMGGERFLGSAAVFPMVAMYCFLHFGKPAGETISSIFGGFLLGVIALYGRSIYGGIMAHMGIAFMMDLFAYIQIYLLKNNHV